ncbi:hypothetical protein ACW9IK_29690 [Pseudomonas gingeri]|uniref:hypothetical protein n=1 Tax=Pseudomonas gingeri TaxID=117681 RepID=UPI0015A0DCED|nr:hypothetical protein [Pseudomonas gingeri]NVZ63696.1 hypothetical protein [Pseudomonas gingeri]NVZ74553.1 hypothetical protein [Pseudomonas gingeri]
MPDQDPSPSPQDVLAASLEGLPPLDIEVIPEDFTPSSRLTSIVQEDPAASLDDYKFKRLQTEIDDLSQQLSERRDLHSIRTKHAWLLFGLTVGWVGVIWLVVLLQGFGQWFLPFPAPGPDEKYLRFTLSNTVIVAFMTSTTATVLGLYGIAAYWLYGKKPPLKSDKSDRQKRDDAKD